MGIPFKFKEQIFEQVLGLTKFGPSGHYGGLKNMANDLGYLPVSVAQTEPNAEMVYETLKELYTEGYVTEPRLVHNRVQGQDGQYYIKHDNSHTEFKEFVTITLQGYVHGYGKIPKTPKPSKREQDSLDRMRKIMSDKDIARLAQMKAIIDMAKATNSSISQSIIDSFSKTVVPAALEQAKDYAKIRKIKF